MMMFAASGLFLTVGSAFAEDSRAVQLAKLGVQLAGHNYATYSDCHAAPEKLHAFKEKSKVRFPAVGGAFDSLFAAGQAEGQQYWAKGAADLGGEDKVRAAVCPNSLQRLDTSLSRR